mgnify:CR=1 FL=1
MKRVLIYLISITIIFFSCKDKEPGNPTSPNTNNDTEIPHSPTPNNNSSNETENPVLMWECENAINYDVYLGKDASPELIIESQQDKEVHMIGLDFSTKYYWKITARQQGGTEKSGPVWNFTTKAEPNAGPGYKMRKYSVLTELPSFVNIMFQVTDMNDRGISDLQTQDFVVYEDNKTVSPTESQMNIKKKDQIPYVLKTVLMIDNSASVAANLQDIKNAATALVNNIVTQQLVAIYKFSENPVLIQDFTSDVSALTSAINSISVGYATTNLYGSIIEGVSRWEDRYETDDIEQGFLLLLTDGSDTQGSHTLTQALAARGDKNIYTIGLGNEIEPSILQQLGNSGFFAVSDVNQLTENFTNIQDEMDLFANSFYWLNYLSPKRGDNDHTLKLEIVNNVNTLSSSYITGSFNSREFTSSYLTLLSPEGGEVWDVGTTQEILWDSYAVNNVLIELSTDDGNTWAQIDMVSDQPKKYEWIVPSVSSEKAKVKITNTDDPQVFDVSDKFVINNPPAVPSNPGPTDENIGQEINVDLIWECSDPEGHSISYDIYFGTDYNPPLVDSNYKSTTYDPGQLEYETTYYWKIIAEDVYGAISESDVWEFKTKRNNPPTTPSNPVPADESVDQIFPLDLTWECSDPENHSITYDIYFGKNNNPPLVDSNYNSTTYDPGKLDYETTYYWKIVAEDVYGAISESEVWEFITKEDPCAGIPSLEYAGKTYNTVQIGDQCWLKENLNYETSNSWCYDNNSNNCETYGRLYTWSAAMNGSSIEGAQGICPDGWHIPTLAEFRELGNYVDNKAAALIDESETLGFTPTVTQNETGFSALFAGARDGNGSFYNLGYGTYFWSSTEYDSDYANRMYLYINSSNVNLDIYNLASGSSVRCVQD